MERTLSERSPFPRNRFLQGLLGWYAVVWIVTAIRPLHPRVWLIENVPVVVLIIALALTYRRFAFSNASYLLVTIFLTLHAMGAHYTYGEVPFGRWVQELFGFRRNHYDRMIHFASGLLFAYPVREILVKRLHLGRFWAVFLPLNILLASSALFELIEWALALIGGAEAGPDYLGAQGDMFDAQKDTGLALTGALISLMIADWTGKIRRRL